MREFKFRAWSKDMNTMLQDGDAFGTNHPLDCVVYAKQGQNVILMQYTGLKDRNGKEIYEGDILRISHREFPQKVYFNSEGYYGTCEFALFELNRSYGFEVIGNIYENPELIDSTESA